MLTWTGSESQNGPKRGVRLTPPLSGCESAPAPQGGRRRKRTKFSKTQYQALIEAFERDSYPDITAREELARRTQIPEPRIQVTTDRLLPDGRARGARNLALSVCSSSGLTTRFA